MFRVEWIEFLAAEKSGRLARKWADDGRPTWNVTLATKRDTSRGSARLTQLKDARETDSRRRHNRRGAPRGCGDRRDGDGRERTIPPADRTWKKWKKMN